MITTTNYIKAMKKRSSNRSFLHQPLSENDIYNIEQILNTSQDNPLSGQIKFKLLPLPKDKANLPNLGTYGVIKNCPAYIVSIVDLNQESLINLGYALEKIVLDLTLRDYGTCWLGGTFTQKSFAINANILDNQTIPAILALGFPASQKTIVDKIISLSAQSRKRKSWKQLFFKNNFATPLEEIDDPNISCALEMLRISPSSANRQPWRILIDNNNNDNTYSFHFYIKKDRPFNYLLKTLHLSNLLLIDIGICMSHFQLALLELSQQGYWAHEKNYHDHSDQLEYVITFHLT